MRDRPTESNWTTTEFVEVPHSWTAAMCASAIVISISSLDRAEIVGLGLQPAHRFDARAKLVCRRRRDRWTAADPAQLVVDLPVRLTGAVMCDRHQCVEFATQLP